MSFIQENIAYIWLLPSLQILIPIAMLIAWSFGSALRYLLQKSQGAEPVQEEDAEAGRVSA
jgi:hypothetical protein